MSDTEIVVAGDARIADDNGDDSLGPDGALGIIPSGEDDLAYASYRIPDLNLERPVMVEIDAASIIPSGEDDLAYWVVLSDYSGNRWEAQGPFSEPGSIELNSETVRRRYVSLVNGANQPGFSIGIVARGNAASGPHVPPKLPEELPRVIINSLTVTVRDVSQADYFSTRPHFTGVSSVGGGIQGSTAGQPVDLTIPHPNDPVAGGKNEATTYEIVRQDVTDSSSQGQKASSTDFSADVIGTIAPAAGDTQVGYSDPTDNDDQNDKPGLGHRYRYFVRGINADGETSNWTQLGTDVHIPLVLQLDTLADPADDVGRYPSIAIVDGHPAIAYVTRGVVSDYLKYTWAIDDEKLGTRWIDPVDLDMELGTSAGHVNLLVVDGVPSISYYGVDAPGGPNDLLYIRADDETGVTWNSAPMVLDSNAGAYSSMRIVDGHPAISYLDADNNNQLAYIRAESPDGVSSSWSTPVHPDTAGETGFHTSMQVVAGNPAIAYLDSANGHTKYVRASDTTGASWGTPVLIDGRGNSGGQISLAIVAGRPAVSYFVFDDTITYARSDDQLGLAWSTRANVFGNTVYSLNAQTKLFVFKGVPAIVHSGTPNGFQLRYANDAGGAGWGSSLDPPDLYIDAGSGKGSENSVTFLPSGLPVFGYRAGNQRQLKFASPFQGL